MAGLYVHTPFCRAKCAYCDFYSGPLRSVPHEAYFAAVLSELSARRSEVLGEGERFRTVYFGGGTPSMVCPTLLAPLAAEAAPDAEITIEANPEDVTAQWVEAVRAIGVNRVSLGVQSLVDSELTAVGRRHSGTDALRAIYTLHRGGIDNVSADLIYGLPEQSMATFEHSLRGILATGVSHLSAYILSYEPGTLLHTRLLKGTHRRADEGLIESMYERLCSLTAAAGMEHYEISNFALPGLYSRHNSSYWDSTPYLGLGPGAHSFDGEVRRSVPPRIRDYMNGPETAAMAEEETEAERHNDMVITALRTARGIDPALLTAEERAACGSDLVPTPEGRLRIPEHRWLVTDSILMPLIRV